MVSGNKRAGYRGSHGKSQSRKGRTNIQDNHGWEDHGQAHGKSKNGQTKYISVFQANQISNTVLNKGRKETSGDAMK